MDWSSENIRESFHQVIRDSYILSKNELEEKHTDFKNNFEKLYSIATESVTNDTVKKSKQTLEMMLKAREQMKNGSVTQLHAEMQVGNNLGHQFIYPKTQTPSREDYVRAVGKINDGSATKELSDKTK
jgi:hypothetical protein